MCKTKEKIWIVVLFLCMILLAGCRKELAEETLLEEVTLQEAVEDVAYQESLEESAQGIEGAAEDARTEEQMIYVHVCGQVVCPGVYQMEADSRIYEAIAAAGGMTDIAAEDYVNQAEFLADGQKIYIPSEEEAEAAAFSKNADGVLSTEEESDNKVNLNTADKAELMTLNGIGEKRAEAIICYRNEHGAFACCEDLMQVEGIKQGTYDKIKDQIKV